MNSKILDTEEILSTMLLYMDNIPFNKASEKMMASSYYWLQKVESLGHVVTNKEIDAKKLYKYIKLNKNLSEATQKACQDDEKEIVLELANWTNNFDPLKCATISQGPQLLLSFANVFNNENQVCQVLSNENIPLQYKVLALPHLDSTQIINCLPYIQDAMLIEAIDALNISIPPLYFGQFQVPNSIKKYAPTALIVQIQEWVNQAIKRHLDKNLVELASYISENNIEKYLVNSVKANNVLALQILYNPKYGSEALKEAILTNNYLMASFLKKSVTPEHLKIARIQRKHEIYNLLRE